MGNEDHSADDVFTMAGRRIRVNGLVQGVGFRPTVWRLAHECGLAGDVLNDGKGVLIHVWGCALKLETFCQRLYSECPPLARIDQLDWTELRDACSHEDFTIVASQATDIETAIIPDAATCPECLVDIQDQTGRRYRYPFTNCTHCGPRLSIIEALPYDRAKTSMSAFDMCPQCNDEYNTPSDRRFHAQPNACPACGPKVWLTDNTGKAVSSDSYEDCITHCAELLKQGAVIAIKGLGGFHLACDASNAQAVETLRRRKRRPSKPLALMARDISVVKGYCHLSDAELLHLNSAAAPIVLLDRLGNGLTLPQSLAPGQNRLGFMLPYTPLHHLLMSEYQTPLVMTSGNLSNDPQVTRNDAAVQQLGGLADYILLHDREIINRVDDSVLQVIDGEAHLLRRGRGFAPEPLVLPPGFEESSTILAAGGEIKNTFCLLSNGKAVLSHHIGDMEVPTIQGDYRTALSLYMNARKLIPDIVAIDDHPTYFSSRLGEELANQYQCQLERVQHHHAHIAACMAEHGLALNHEPVLGVALDGLGAGDNGQLWGGEFLLANYEDYQRLGHFESVPMPGGNRASIEPWRNTFAHLHQEFGWELISEQYSSLEFVREMENRPVGQLITMLDRSINSPLTSSAGRLFDAVAGLLGVGGARQSYEGEAAILLQTLAESASDQSLPAYPYEIAVRKTCKVLGWKPMWQSILDDCLCGVDEATIAFRFHQTLIEAVGQIVVEILVEARCDSAILTGGTFQNRLLAQGVIKILKQNDIRVLMPKRYPANDGGLSLGQAVIAAARNK